MNRRIVTGLAVAAALALIGVLAFAFYPRSETQHAAAVDPPYLLPQPPPGAEDVITVRTSAKDRQHVIVEGRVGGRVNPWIKDAAAFSIVDRSLTPCSELPGDTCKTPWDYCCETDLSKATLLVTVHDGDNQLVKADARALLGIAELDTVVIEGHARRDKNGNVSIVASKVYVAPDQKE